MIHCIHDDPTKQQWQKDLQTSLQTPCDCGDCMVTSQHITLRHKNIQCTHQDPPTQGKNGTNRGFSKTNRACGAFFIGKFSPPGNPPTHPPTPFFGIFGAYGSCTKWLAACESRLVVHDSRRGFCGHWNMVAREIISGKRGIMTRKKALRRISGNFGEFRIVGACPQ